MRFWYEYLDLGPLCLLVKKNQNLNSPLTVFLTAKVVVEVVVVVDVVGDANDGVILQSSSPIKNSKSSMATQPISVLPRTTSIMS
jgi:hypothetical protein